MSKLLSLVIPTYNRAAYLDKQIAWAVESAKNVWPFIDIVICDNASNDDTANICAKWKKKISDDEKIRIFRNDINIGLVKNCLVGIERAAAKFVWLIGDDDPIDLIATEKVVDIIKSHLDLNIIHLNHRCISGIDNSVIISKFYQEDTDFYALEKGNIYLSSLLEKQHTGGLMFITANVINRKKALEFILHNPPDEETLLAYPMFLNAGLASMGPLYLLSECLVDCVYHQSSWSDKFERVQYEEVPKTLVKLLNKGISKRAVSYCLEYQFNELHTARDCFYTLRKNPSYVSKNEFKVWLRRWLLKGMSQWKVLSQ